MKYRAAKKKWMVTGAAGFIGSHLVENLLKQDCQVIGVDNFLTGFQHNLKDIQWKVTPDQWSRFEFHELDVCDSVGMAAALDGVDIVLHQAALGSVPRSIANPLPTHQNNVNGLLNLLNILKDRPNVRLIFASSSSVYGDNPTLPKMEDQLGIPQSPYAVSKRVGELYAMNFAKVYGLRCIGLRYFNVFGPRQNPEGAYAAVIPKWTEALIRCGPVVINGDGKTARDFSYVSNIVHANLLAGLAENEEAFGKIYNVACGERISLMDLYHSLKLNLKDEIPALRSHQPEYADFRKGDIRDSLASIEKAKKMFGYEPLVKVQQGLQLTAEWYLRRSNEVLYHQSREPSCESI